MFGTNNWLQESMSGSLAMQSAFDSVALRFGDAIDAATQDMTDFATDVKSFVATSVGLQGDDSDDSADENRQAESKREALVETPAHRAQSSQMVSDFCENFPVTRVVPNRDELEGFWNKCNALSPGATAGALHEQLSYANGDFAWQPRLRALYIVDYLHRKGGAGKEIGETVKDSAGQLIEYLLEVPQCKEKAQQVIATLEGKQADRSHLDSGDAADDEGEAPSASATGSSPYAAYAVQPQIAARTEAPLDLLDFAEPSASSSSGDATAKPVDLLTAGDLISMAEPPTRQDQPPCGGALEDIFGSPIISPALAVAAPPITTVLAPPRPAAPAQTLLTTSNMTNTSGVTLGGASSSGSFLMGAPLLVSNVPSGGSIGSLPGLMVSGTSSSSCPTAASFQGPHPALGTASSGQFFAPLHGASHPQSGMSIGAAWPASSSATGGYGGCAQIGGGWPMMGPPRPLQSSAVGSIQRANMPYIPAAAELPPVGNGASKDDDPFAFVAEHIGMTNMAGK